MQQDGFRFAFIAFPKEPTLVFMQQQTSYRDMHTLRLASRDSEVAATMRWTPRAFRHRAGWQDDSVKDTPH
jgi:hypothetical protein